MGQFDNGAMGQFLEVLIVFSYFCEEKRRPIVFRCKKKKGQILQMTPKKTKTKK
jgi:hypothetical protein